MGRIPAFHSPSRFTADSEDVSPSLGAVAFLGGTSDTVWWVNLRARSGNAVLLELFFSCSPLNTSWPYLHAPIIVTSHSTHIKNQQFLDSDAGDDYCWDHRSHLLNKLLKQSGQENWVYSFALVARKETRWCFSSRSGQREYAQQPRPLELFLTVLILPAWQDTIAYADILFPAGGHNASEVLLSARHQSLPTLQA